MAEFISTFALEIAKGLAPIIAGLLIALLVRLFKQMGFALSAERQAEVEKRITDIIFEVEEIGAARLKAGLAKLNADEKIKIAIAKAVDRIPGVTADEAKALVQTQLPKVGLGATDFAKAVAAAAFNQVK